jgi:proline racemase
VYYQYLSPAHSFNSLEFDYSNECTRTATSIITETPTRQIRVLSGDRRRKCGETFSQLDVFGSEAEIERRERICHEAQMALPPIVRGWDFWYGEKAYQVLMQELEKPASP